MDESGDEVERVLADLEQQAQGLHLRDRDDELAGLLPAEHARVGLEERLHGSLGRRLAVRLRGGVRLEGVLAEMGRGWLLLELGAREWCVLVPALLGVTGLGPRALVEAARPASARLGPGAPLRDLAERRLPVLALLVDGTRLDGPLGRVGSDYIEMSVAGTLECVPFDALQAVAGPRA